MVKEQNPTCVTFEGGGGMVEVTTCAEKQGSSIEVASQEWENQAREFMRTVK
jgi:hypothetical protein